MINLRRMCNVSSRMDLPIRSAPRFASFRLRAAIESDALVDQLRGLLRTPEIIVRTWRAARQSIGDITEAEVREALQRLDPLWDELFPAEQARIVQLLVERVDVSPDRADIYLRTEGLTNRGDRLQELRQAIQQAPCLRPASLDKNVETLDELLAPILIVEYLSVVGEEYPDDVDKPISTQ